MDEIMCGRQTLEDLDEEAERDTTLERWALEEGCSCGCGCGCGLNRAAVAHSRTAMLWALVALLLAAGTLAGCADGRDQGSVDTVEGCTDILVAAWERGDIRVSYPGCDDLSDADLDRATDGMAERLALDEPIE